MSSIPMEQVADAIQHLRQYHVRIEQSPGLIYEGEIDREGERQYIKTYGEGFPSAEMLWVGEQGFGRRLGSDTWFKLLGRRLSGCMESALALIREDIVTSEREDDRFIVVETVVDFNSEPKEAYWNLFSTILKDLDIQMGHLLDRMVDIIWGLSLVTRVSISKEDSLLKEIEVQVLNLPLDDVHRNAHVRVAFSEPQWEIPRLGEGEIQADTVEIPISVLLFLRVPRIAGWCQKNHMHWAERSIALIEANDAKKRSYTGIYDPYWFKSFKDGTSKIKQESHHPIVIGAYYEDEKLLGKCEQNPQQDSFYHEWFGSDPNHSPSSPHYFSNDKYLRDMHHFGGESEGLKDKWYFLIRLLSEGVAMSPTQPGKRYYSARNWGYGGNRVDPKLNRLTFTEAIKQYNRYSLDGKRCAYLMLGHVLHLLQDQGQPDHAALVDHAASANNEPEAYEDFSICYILAAEVVLALSPDLVLTIMTGNPGVIIGEIVAKSGILASVQLPIFLGALAACKLSIDPDQVGYERLIKDRFDYDRAKKTLVLKKSKLVSESLEAEKDIDPTGPLYADTYDDFFKQVAQKSATALKEIRSQHPNEDLLDHPLGLGPLPVLFPQIPGCNPDIDGTDTSETAPFFKLTNKVVKDIVCYGAGFLQRFYEIVNHPPFVEQVAVVKAVPGLKPVAFAQFAPDLYLPECQKCQVRYSAKWDHQGGSSTRSLTVKSEPLSPDHRAYIFIQFGPNLGPGKSKVVRPETLTLKLAGTSPTNQPIGDIPVKLYAADDPQLGRYYWGPFQPTNPWGKKYKLTLEIQAKDATAHFEKRTYPGDELDSHPESVAMVDHNTAPKYPLTDYQPGVDRNHKIEIGTPIVADHLEDNQTVLNATPVNLGFSTASLLNPDFQTKQNPDAGAEFYPDLTLHSATDVDFFDVRFQTHAHDKNLQWGIKKEVGGGLTVSSFPPVLDIRVKEAFGGCLRLQLYDSQTAQTHVFDNTNKVTIERPQDFFPNERFYLAVRNPDYAKQGKLRYGLFIRYICGGLEVGGPLLYEFWEWWPFRFPPPPGDWDFDEVIGDPVERIRYYNPHQFISDLRGFLPELVQRLGIEDQVERDTWLANERHELGQIAQGVGLPTYAELLYKEAIQTYRQHNITFREVAALQDLQATYAVQGRVSEAGQITQRLEELGE